MNLARRRSSSSRHRLARLALRRAALLRGPARARRPRRPGSSPATAIVGDRRRAVPVLRRRQHPQRPARPRRPDRHADRRRGRRVASRRPVDAASGVRDQPAAGRARHQRLRAGSRGLFLRGVRRASRRAVQIGGEQTTRWLGLIVGGSGRSWARRSTTRPRRRRCPVRSGSRPDRRTSSGRRADHARSTWPAILSANLALVNILPFPPLDGGRMLMIVLKRFFGARISSGPSG